MIKIEIPLTRPNLIRSPNVKNHWAKNYSEDRKLRTLVWYSMLQKAMELEIMVGQVNSELTPRP